MDSLREDILPGIAPNRRAPQLLLLNEFMDLLSAYENIDHMDHTPPTTTMPLVAQVKSTPSTADKIQSALSSMNQSVPTPFRVDHMDTDLLANDQMGAHLTSNQPVNL
ncbi:hypothetical protein Dimus_009395 [Dionaea muscipula]